jgi:hypothetical protein
VSDDGERAFGKWWEEWMQHLLIGNADYVVDRRSVNNAKIAFLAGFAARDAEIAGLRKTLRRLRIDAVNFLSEEQNLANPEAMERWEVARKFLLIAVDSATALTAPAPVAEGEP